MITAILTWLNQRRGSQRRRSGKVMFVPAEINIDLNPLVNRISNSPLPTPKGPASPGPSPLRSVHLAWKFHKFALDSGISSPLCRSIQD